MRRAIGAVALLAASAAGAAAPVGSLTSVERVQRLGPRPVTVRLEPRAREASASPGREVAVSVALEGIEGVAIQPVRINVFLDRPDADRNLAISDPHYVGFVQLMPRRGGIVAARSQRLTLRRGASCATIRRMTVTLVPVVGRNSAPVQSDLRIGRVYVRCERLAAAA